MIKIISTMIIMSLALMADTPEIDKTKKNKEKSEKEQTNDSSFKDSINSLFEVRDPDKVDNEKGIKKIFEEN